jgi:carboxy-cis,cis-muconate cyclase
MQGILRTTFLSLLAVSRAAKHELIIGTFGTQYLYTVEFDDEALTLDLLANTSVPAAGSWIALSVSAHGRPWILPPLTG